MKSKRRGLGKSHSFIRKPAIWVSLGVAACSDVVGSDVKRAAWAGALRLTSRAKPVAMVVKNFMDEGSRRHLFSSLKS